MKEILKVDKASAYAKLNGLTFKVSEILSQSISLFIYVPEHGKEVKVDFSHSEVFIVDIQNELQKAYDIFNWGLDLRTYPNLQKYCTSREILVNQPNYNCPA